MCFFLTFGHSNWRRNVAWGVFENRGLIRIFGPKSDKVTGEWRRPHNEEFYELYSPNIIQVILQEACDEQDMWHEWGRGGVVTGFWLGNVIKRNHLQEPGIDVRIILKWIFKKWEWGMDWIVLA